MAVAEHLLARLIASGVSELRTDGHGRRCRTGREARRSGGGDESTAPLVLLGHAPEQRLEYVEARQQKGLRPGGFGILMAQTMVDELIYNEVHNEVVFVKYLD